MKRIAIVATVYRYLSHAQHIGDRFLVGYPRDGAWHKPDMKVVSLYVDQKPQNDQSTERAKEFDFQVYPTIAETLRCGGSKLAVDAVLVIGEHGDYQRNEEEEQQDRVQQPGHPRLFGVAFENRRRQQVAD